MPIEFGMDATGAYGAMGYIAGVAEEVTTNAYVGAAVTYAHSILGEAFNRWMDARARLEPQSFQHVYEWPTEFHGYQETVGNPSFRLWANVLSGNGRDRVATFKFLASRRPVPVNPILLEPGPTGAAVKQGVHVFVLKAQAMEYGMDITVAPKLAQYLAYVIGSPSGEGEDADPLRHGNNGENSTVMLSKGPVRFTAGGQYTRGKFTEAFMEYWASMASDDFNTLVRPTLERDMFDHKDFAGKVGKVANKPMSISAQASRNNSAYAQAREAAVARLKRNEKDYIGSAAARRSLIYGE